MADDVDIATAINERALERAMAGRGTAIPAGEPGDCRTCYHWSPRLVGGRRAPCRDGRGR